VQESKNIVLQKRGLNGARKNWTPTVITTFMDAQIAESDRKGQKIFSTSKCPDPLCGPTSLIFSACWDSLSADRPGRTVDCSRLRMSGTINPLPLYDFMVWTGILYIAVGFEAVHTVLMETWFSN
jgi:hypothetical protein